jgi:hypothetical protein
MRILKTSGLILLLGLSVLKTECQPFQSMRASDDNHSLATDSADWKWHRKIKEIAFHQKRELGTVENPDYPMISIGGDDREQFRYYSHLNFGDVPEGSNDEDIYLQHRLQVHGDLILNNYLRIFLQLNSCRANGRNNTIHQGDRDDLGIMQAFIDLNLKTQGIQLRLGRQEFYYGMERILALRDGPTIRQNFDGARLAFTRASLKSDLIFVRPVLYKVGVFDNQRREKEYFFGNYWSFSISENHLMDLYYFKARYENACFAGDTAADNRQSIGIRINKSVGAVTFDAEYTYQFGFHGERKINAWHLSSQVAYRWLNLSWQPRILIREGIFSGDKNASDNEINTFRPVSAKPPVHDLVPIGPANIIVLSPEAEFVLTRDLFITLRYIYVRRYSENDGMYPSDMRKMTRSFDEPGLKLGNQIINGWALEFLYLANKHISLLLYGGIFKADEYIRNTGSGKNIEAFSVRAHYKF